MSLGKVWNKASTRIMVYGGDWNSAQTTVRAITFSKMLELARDRVKFYVGDLYHDALWLNEYLIGPMQFEWVPRESGTHIGETAMIVKDDDWADSARYRFVIREDDNQKWVLETWELVVHEGTPLEECDYAMTGAGCIYHPSPPMPVKEPHCNHDSVAVINGVCECGYSGFTTVNNLPTGDWREEVPGTGKDYYGNTITMDTPVARDDLVEEIMGLLFEPNIPTLRNDLNTEPKAPLRKEMKMDDIIRDLREKFSEAEASKDQLESYQSDISDGIDELETYMNDLDELINSLDSLPEVSIYVDLDTVSFDS